VRVSTSDSLALFTSPLSHLRVTKFDALHLLKVSRLTFLGHKRPDGAALSQDLWAAREPSFHVRGQAEAGPPKRKQGDCDFESVFFGTGYVTEKFFEPRGFESRPYERPTG